MWDEGSKPDIKSNRKEFLNDINKYDENKQKNIVSKKESPQSNKKKFIIKEKPIKKDQNSQISDSKVIEIASKKEDKSEEFKRKPIIDKENKTIDEKTDERLKEIERKEKLLDEKLKKVDELEKKLEESLTLTPKKSKSNTQIIVKNDSNFKKVKIENKNDQKETAIPKKENPFREIFHILKIQRRFRAFRLINQVLRDKNHTILHNTNKIEIKARNSTKKAEKLVIYFEKNQQKLIFYGFTSFFSKCHFFEYIFSFGKPQTHSLSFLKELCMELLKLLFFTSTNELKLYKFTGKNNKKTPFSIIVSGKTMNVSFTSKFSSEIYEEQGSFHVNIFIL